MKNEEAAWLLNLPNTVSEGIALLTQCREHMPPEDQQVIDDRDRVLDIEDIYELLKRAIVLDNIGTGLRARMLEVFIDLDRYSYSKYAARD